MKYLFTCITALLALPTAAATVSGQVGGQLAAKLSQPTAQVSSILPTMLTAAISRPALTPRVITRSGAGGALIAARSSRDAQAGGVGYQTVFDTLQLAQNSLQLNAAAAIATAPTRPTTTLRNIQNNLQTTQQSLTKQLTDLGMQQTDLQQRAVAAKQRITTLAAAYDSATTNRNGATAARVKAQLTAAKLELLKISEESAEVAKYQQQLAQFPAALAQKQQAIANNSAALLAGVRIDPATVGLTGLTGSVTTPQLASLTATSTPQSTALPPLGAAFNNLDFPFLTDFTIPDDAFAGTAGGFF